jgi:hypothetical protein
MFLLHRSIAAPKTALFNSMKKLKKYSWGIYFSPKKEGNFPAP